MVSQKNCKPVICRHYNSISCYSRRVCFMDIAEIGRSRSEWEQLIDEWIFSERDRLIIKRRLLDGICFEPLAEEFQMSDRHIKRIVKRSTDILMAHI